jgi:hypothetical protein
MNSVEFGTALREELAKHSAEAARRIEAILARVPAKARSLDIEVFPSQDADGFFGVRASFEGPDLYALNKSIDQFADIIEPKYTESGLVPPIPMVQTPNAGFAVNDIVVDSVATWLVSVWESLGSSAPLPIRVVGHDGYGTVTPLTLGM